MLPRLALLLLPILAAAQPVSRPADTLTVSLLTMGHGDAIYEWFGHNAIQIEDSAGGLNVAYNYGLFTFEQENFILRFLQGRMVYWMAGTDGTSILRDYRDMNRSVLKQELNLSPQQKLALLNFLRWTAEFDSEYRYDYYTANCSTKVRDALDRIVDGQLRKQLEAIPTGRSYRWHTRRLSAGNPVMYSALYYLLGSGGDVPLSAWQEAFLPSQLAEHLQSVTIRNESGQSVPLVRAQAVLFEASRPPLPAGPPNWTMQFLLVGIVIAASLYLLAHLARRGRGFRIMLAILSALWLLIAAGAGALGAGAWLLTTHVAAYRNENLFQLNPLALPLIVLVPALALGAKRGALTGYWLSAIVLAISIVGLLIQLLPAFDQVNGQMIALMLPTHLGVFLMVRHLNSVNQSRDISPDSSLNPEPAPAR